MANKKSDKLDKPLNSIRHADKRANIPTEELRDFVTEDENAPKTVLYPRDPSLDPQLVWKGKDEQDAADLAVPAVPIYIQEKVQPQAIIENVRAQARMAKPDAQLALFADFNGLAFEDVIDFYHHEQNWTNRLILGDSLLVMTSLAEKEGLKGQVQMIYLDPPYGIKFGSNWQVSTRKRDVKDGKAEDATRQPEQIKAFRDTWELGIHSYLAYLRDRLVVARELLTESGSVFVQIGDENVHLVRCVLDEVFGSENFISLISFVTTTSQTSDYVPCVTDFILWYGKDREQTKFRELLVPKDIQEAKESSYARFEVDGCLVDREPGTGTARLLVFDNLTSRSGGESTTQPCTFDGVNYVPRSGGWKTSSGGLQRLEKGGRLFAKGSSLLYKRYFSDFPFLALSNSWADTQPGGFGKDPKVYVVQTNVMVIERCLLMTTDPGDLVLDPTCGSGTTAYVAEQWGRRWITVDTSRVALALARTRLMSARYPYFTLADSPEGVRQEAEWSGLLPPTPLPSWNDARAGHTAGDVKKGFVYRRVPHVTLKSIANNEEIDALHAKWQAQLDPVRAELNRLLGQTWEEWQIPREADPKWPQKARDLHTKWWTQRRERQKEIDASIARRADTELLYDQPYEDKKRIRVAGPFTVESLSPHRVLSTDDERPATETAGQQESAEGRFVPMILDNLRKAGVQNTVKAERLKFDRLEPYAGVWLHAAGEYTDADGKSRRVAVCIGPEYGTVGPDQVKDAAKEAVQGLGFDLLVVCGFAFDPHVSEEARRFGKLVVLTARMNPDLAMGDALLKKTGAGNLFMVFGEPDIEITRGADGRLTVEIKGLDVYDPTTGEIRSNSTDDIACWFVDTDYNGESFFVRHAYFTGEGDPYERLKRALRAEIDEAAWAALYSTTSYPFDPPTSGKIAVKVINHYGDEILKVYQG